MFKASAKDHMARDRALLAEGAQDSVLLFYEWDSFCITYGLFARPERALKMDVCQSLKIPVVPRPTGGGILFHQDDFPFSLFIPHDALENSFESFWTALQSSILAAIQPLLPPTKEAFSVPKHQLIDRFCMAEAHTCDFVWNGKKYGGAAFRKGKKGWLCQATLFTGDLAWEKCKACLQDPLSLENMKATSLFLPKVESLQKDVANAITRCFL